MEKFSLIIFDDQSKTKQFFVTALKSSIPRLSNETIEKICSVIHNEGLCICAYGPLEIVEMYKEKLDGFNLKSTIGVCNEKLHANKK